MILANYHCHSSFCDGIGEPAAYAEEAIRKGFASFGFTSHAPLPVPNNWTMKREDMAAYLETIAALKEQYRGKLDIYRGLEVDFIPGVMGPHDETYRTLGLDYVIGSVHVIPDTETGEYRCVDYTTEEYEHLLSRVFENDITAMVHDYFERVRRMIDAGGFRILAHIDLIRKKNRNNRYYSEEEDWYRKETEETLEKTASAGIMIEMNTGGIARGAMDSPYPGFRTLARACDMGIPIVLNSDAHRPEHIDFWFDEGRRMLYEAGYRKRRVLKKGEWVDTDI